MNEFVFLNEFVINDIVQAALDIIGFDYSRISISGQNSVSAAFT